MIGRPSLKALLEGNLTKIKQNARITEAGQRYGYSQREIADCLNLRCATVTRLANRL